MTINLVPQNIDWSKLAKPDFWLEGIAGQNLVASPLSENGFRNLFLFIFAVFLIGGIFLRLIKVFLPMQHPLQPRLSSWTGNFIWMGLLGILWWLFNQWGPLLFIGSKLWLLVGAVWLSVVLYLIVKYFILDYRLELSYYKKKYLNNQDHSKNSNNENNHHKKTKEA